MTQYYYQTTDYPNIYKNAYWGTHQICRLTNGQILRPEADIIQNRNDFIKRFEIVKYKRPTPRQWDIQEEKNGRTRIDHREYYEDIHKRTIYVCSQYDPFPMYRQMKPIYSPSQWSGYQIVETTQSKKLLIQKIFSKLPTDVSAYILTFMKPIKYSGPKL